MLDNALFPTGAVTSFEVVVFLAGRCGIAVREFNAFVEGNPCGGAGASNKTSQKHPRRFSRAYSHIHHKPPLYHPNAVQDNYSTNLVFLCEFLPVACDRSPGRWHRHHPESSTAMGIKTGEGYGRSWGSPPRTGCSRTVRAIAATGRGGGQQRLCERPGAEEARGDGENADAVAEEPSLRGQCIWAHG